MTHLQRHPEVVYTDLEDGAVLLHGETKFFYSLDPVGADVWRLLNLTDTVEGLVQQVLARYDVTPELARASISEFVGALEREQLVTRDEGRADGAALETEPSGAQPAAGLTGRKPFGKPELIKHDEPLHAVVMNPFDPQLPLAE
jgi:hypothetical protein